MADPVPAKSKSADDPVERFLSDEQSLKDRSQELIRQTLAERDAALKSFEKARPAWLHSRQTRQAQPP